MTSIGLFIDSINKNRFYAPELSVLSKIFSLKRPGLSVEEKASLNGTMADWMKALSTIIEHERLLQANQQACRDNLALVNGILSAIELRIISILKPNLKGGELLLRPGSYSEMTDSILQELIRNASGAQKSDDKKPTLDAIIEGMSTKWVKTGKLNDQQIIDFKQQLRHLFVLRDYAELFVQVFGAILTLDKVAGW